MRCDVIRAFAAFTGLTPDTNAVDTLRTLPRYGDIDLATGNALFGAEAVMEAGHKEAP